MLEQSDSSPVQQRLQGLPERRPLAPLQPELRVVRVADERPAAVQAAVDQRVVGLPPVLQTGVHPLNQEVHHPSIGGVADEQHLRRSNGRKMTKPSDVVGR